MSNYNLGALNDKEFEALVCDLVGVLLGLRVERFKPGKDAGVDGRWFATPQREGVVQCKHWMRSGYSALINTLIKKEKTKIDRLNPARYILATSVELSRQNKKRILQALAPHIKAETDILGLEDIEDLLAKHPDVEKRHYKVWLSSTSVLSRIFNNAVIGRSDSDAASIQAKIRLVVKTNAFDKAASLLAARNTVIITGAPGIGKTTLAEQLIVEHQANGFELVSMHKISDGEAVFSPTNKQIFYFDDYLGRNMLEALKLKHDSQIIGFIRRVYRDKLKRFVLTSRSSILNQGKHLSDLFSLEKTEKNEYEIRIDELSRLDKARILYSHVWHSALPDAMLDELFGHNRYKIIADHPNFNPRLISFITDSDKTGTLHAADYWGYVTSTLNNPQDLWRHFFGQISQDCRDLVYLVVLNGKSISEHHLRDAFRCVRLAASTDVGKIEHDGLVAIKICTGSLLNRNIGRNTDAVTYDLYNPSIADYVLREVPNWDVFADFFSALKTVASLKHLREMLSAEFISMDGYVRIVDVIATKNGLQTPDDAYGVELCGLILENSELLSRFRERVRTTLNGLAVCSYDGNDEVLMKVMLAALERGLLENPNKTTAELCDHVAEWPLGNDEMHLLGALVRFGQGSETQALASKAKQCMIQYWKETIGDYVDEGELLQGIFNEEQFDEARKELFDEVASKLAETGMDFGQAEIEAVCKALPMDEIVNRNIEWDSHTDDYSDRPPAKSATEVDDSEIDDLFERNLPS